MLLDYVDNYGAYPYYQGHETSYTQHGKTLKFSGPTLMKIITNVAALNRGSPSESTEQHVRWDEGLSLAAIPWKVVGLYCKSGDPKSHGVLYFDTAVEHALNEVSQLLDLGACLKYARTNHPCNDGCDSFPCIKTSRSL